MIGVLKKHRASFQLTGGFAASLYGSGRGFHDIDILIRRTSLLSILPDIRQKLAFGPAQYRDRHFDVSLATLKIYSTEIDLVMDCRIRNHRTGAWHKTPGLVGKPSWKRAFGLRVPMEPKAKLIRIKRTLGRRKDIQDVAAMTS